MFTAVTIVFSGLICHFQDPQAAHRQAIIVYEAQHHAKLIVPYDDIVDKNQIGTFLGGGQLDASGTRVEFDISKDDNYQFGDLTKGYTNIDNGVPHLTSNNGNIGITDGTASEVGLSIVQTHIVATMDYSGGDLKTNGSCMVTWKADPKHANCKPDAIGKTMQVAPTSTFTADASDKPQLKDSDGNLLDLTANAKLEVRNVTNQMGAHFGYKEYLWLDDGHCMVSIGQSNCSLERPAGPSKHGVYFDVTSPECTNSQFP